MQELALVRREQSSEGRRERVGTCPKHGELIETGDRWRDGQGNWHWYGCQKCEREADHVEEPSGRQHRAQEYLGEANIPNRFRRKTLGSFQVETEEQRVALESSRLYVADFPENLAAGRCLLFSGPVGTGKTHLACGVLRALAIEGIRVLYVTVGEAIRMIRNTWRNNSRESEIAVLGKLCCPDLLVLDEIGVQYGSEAEQIQLFEILNLRYNAVKPTIAISNLGLDGITAYLGERAMDRLRENGGQMIVFKGESWRASQGR